MMRKLLFGLAALPFLTSIALAGQPLRDQQMDTMIAAGTPTNAQGQPLVISCICVPTNISETMAAQPLQLTELEVALTKAGFALSSLSPPGFFR
jgi:hypothetical protein